MRHHNHMNCELPVTHVTGHQTSSWRVVHSYVCPKRPDLEPQIWFSCLIVRILYFETLLRTRDPPSFRQSGNRVKWVNMRLKLVNLRTGKRFCGSLIRPSFCQTPELYNTVEYLPQANIYIYIYILLSDLRFQCQPNKRRTVNKILRSETNTPFCTF